jgi:hypothetical protein
MNKLEESYDYHTWDRLELISHILMLSETLHKLKQEMQRKITIQYIRKEKNND